MDAVILMVGRLSEPIIYDIEIMPDIPMAELVDAIAQAFRWEGNYVVEVAATGQRVPPENTLADANAWDGTHLRFIPIAGTRKSEQNSISEGENTANSNQPLAGMRELGVPNSPQSHSVANRDNNGGDTHVPVSKWKKISNSNDDKEITHEPDSPIKGWKLTNKPKKEDDLGK